MFYTTDLPVSEIWKSMQLIFNQYCNYSDYTFFWRFISQVDANIKHGESQSTWPHRHGCLGTKVVEWIAYCTPHITTYVQCSSSRDLLALSKIVGNLLEHVRVLSKRVFGCWPKAATPQVWLATTFRGACFVPDATEAATKNHSAKAATDCSEQICRPRHTLPHLRRGQWWPVTKHPLKLYVRCTRITIKKLIFRDT
jgi:hypothetical protein